MMMPSALIHIPLYHRDENTIGAAGGILITIQSIIALATAVNEILYVRNVNTFYVNGAFYVLTYGLSNKLKQIEVNPTVALAGEWFTAHGKGVNLWYFGKEGNDETYNA